ncbi:conserved hypothetical protein [Mycolicibacter sinensis]|uniref:Uncharacterized protein n=1 Tax=Mycolicibacter sinensis (strain JDM601) TaxID=875328 RepID=F5Z399_MYCSD|nr:conserved hypothetical protein [Mycolicibacter sinensis]
MKSADSLDELRAGGHPMVPVGSAHADGLTPHPDWCSGALMGKRYVDSSGAEVLVTRAGIGTLGVGVTAMTLKAAAPLPASD